MRVDAHQHYWNYDPVRDQWIGSDMRVLQRDFLPADVQPLMQAAGIDAAVAVQADQSETETIFLLDLAGRHSFIHGVVGWVDLRSPSITQRLEALSTFPKLKGFRHILQGEPDRAGMLHPDFQRGIAALSAHHFSYDLLVLTDQLEYAAQLADAHPQQRFVVDHLAKPPINHDDLEQWTKGIKELGRRPNVSAKISGLITEADVEHWAEADLRPVLDIAVQAFGVHRLMFGSDWPVCLLAGEYVRWTAVAEAYFSSFSIDEKDRIFGRNAIEFYHL